MNCKNCFSAFLASAVILICGNATGQNRNAPLAMNSSKTVAAPGHYVPWKPIKESDITRHRRVWEDISLSEKNNDLFGPHNTGIALVNALINGVMDARMLAYSPVDDRFTTGLKAEEFSAITEKISNNNTHITKFMIKEDSLWLNTGEVTVQIVGLAPVGYTTGPDGVIKEEPLFWVFYPDCRVYLSQYIAAGSYSWDDILERRSFTGKVTKVHETPPYTPPYKNTIRK